MVLDFCGVEEVKTCAHGELSAAHKRPLCDSTMERLMTIPYVLEPSCKERIEDLVHLLRAALRRYR